MDTNKTLLELFSFSGFRAKNFLKGKFGDHKARVIKLQRQKKQQNVLDVVNDTEVSMIAKNVNHEILMLQTIEYMFVMRRDVSNARDVIECV